MAFLILSHLAAAVYRPFRHTTHTKYLPEPCDGLCCPIYTFKTNKKLISRTPPPYILKHLCLYGPIAYISHIARVRVYYSLFNFYPSSAHEFAALVIFSS